MKKSVLFFLFFFIIIFQPVSAEPFEYKKDVRGFAIKLTDWNGQPYIKKGELPPATRLMIALQYPEKHKRSSDPRGVAYCNGMCHNNSWHGMDLKKITPKEWEKYNPGMIKKVKEDEKRRYKLIFTHIGYRLQKMREYGMKGSGDIHQMCNGCHNRQRTRYKIRNFSESLIKGIIMGEAKAPEMVKKMPEYQGLGQFKNMVIE